MSRMFVWKWHFSMAFFFFAEVREDGILTGSLCWRTLSEFNLCTIDVASGLCSRSGIMSGLVSKATTVLAIWSVLSERVTFSVLCICGTA